MTVDPIAQALHHKSVRGEVLTPEERERLRSWHAQMDEEEAAKFAKNAPPDDVTDMQVQMDQALSRLVSEAQALQSLESTNAQLRAEINALKHRIAQKRTPQTV